MKCLVWYLVCTSNSEQAVVICRGPRLHYLTLQLPLLSLSPLDSFCLSQPLDSSSASYGSRWVCFQGGPRGRQRAAWSVIFIFIFLEKSFNFLFCGGCVCVVPLFRLPNSVHLCCLLCWAFQRGHSGSESLFGRGLAISALELLASLPAAFFTRTWVKTRPEEGVEQARFKDTNHTTCVEPEDTVLNGQNMKKQGFFQKFAL